MTRDFEIVLDGGTFFESPRWHSGRWWCSDLYRRVVLAFEAGSAAEQVAEVPGRPSGLGWLPDGSLLVVSMLDRRLVRIDEDGASTMFADLSSYFPHPANDMVVSSTGAIWVGSLGFDMAARDSPQPSPLVNVTPDATVTIATDGLMVPNGAVVTPDGSTLIVAETLGSCLTAFTIGANGVLSDQRRWASLGDAPKSGGFMQMFGELTSSPDGIALDAEGCIWVADPTQKNCRRIREGGEVLDSIPAPSGQSIFACGLGGPSGDELLLCCAPDASERRRTSERAAVLALCRVAVPAA